MLKVRFQNLNQSPHTEAHVIGGNIEFVRLYECKNWTSHMFPNVALKKGEFVASSCFVNVVATVGTLTFRANRTISS